MPLRPQGAHHTCRGAHVCVLESRPCVLGTPKVVPWCLLGAVKAFLGAPSFESPPPPLPPFKEQCGSFSLFLEETSICLRRHNGIINNYKLKFQKSISLHLHHLSQVRAQCPSGAHAVHVWRARDARLARPRCVSGSPVVRAQCVSGSPVVRVRPARGVHLARQWCASGPPATSSHGSWSLNHQTSRIFLLSS